MYDLISAETVHGDKWAARIRAEHDRLGSRCPCGNTTTAIADVWCNQCDQPATDVFHLENGERVSKCSTHAWLLRAPRG